jgi:hypothetical protein
MMRLKDLMKREKIMLDLDGLKDKLKVFNYIGFDEEPHVYYDKNSDFVFPVSGTKWVEQYCNPFDPKGYMLKACAKKKGILPFEMQSEWEENKIKAQIRGTLCHKYLEDIANGTHNYYNGILKDVADKFYTEQFHSGEYNILATELVVGDMDIPIVGTLDVLAQQDDRVVIMDYKTGKRITNEKKNKKMMLHPFNKFNDSSLSRYSLQLNLYRYLLHKHTGIWVEELKLIWLNEDEGYEIIDCFDMSNEVKGVFETVYYF